MIAEEYLALIGCDQPVQSLVRTMYEQVLPYAEDSLQCDADFEANFGHRCDHDVLQVDIMPYLLID